MSSSTRSSSFLLADDADGTFSAHQAKVPIAVHLDHATDPDHIELAIKLAEEGIAFDSIMVDASHADVRPISFPLINIFILTFDPLSQTD